MSKYVRTAVLIAAAALASGCSNSLTAYALSSGYIIGFSTSSPGTINSSVAITGLEADDYVVQLSYQPSSGTLYCITSNSELCTVDPTTGVAALVSSTPFAVSGSSTVTLSDPVIAFDPVLGDLRVISSGSDTGSAYNLLVNPDGALDGGPVGPTYDTLALSYASGQTTNGGTPDLVGIAYSNPIAGAGSTTLYGLDETTSSLVYVGTQNVSVPTTVDAGQVTVVGQLGLTLSSNTGFTIDQSGGTGYASLQNGGAATLYTVDLSTGALTELGAIGTGNQTVTSLVIVPGD